jgi:hypothetical protein
VLLLALAVAGCHKAPPTLAALAAEGQTLSSAPVQFYGQETINAPPDKVYGLLIGVQSWPAWQHDVSNVVAVPPIVVGSQFSWETGGANIQTTIRRTIPDQSLAWTGDVANFHAIHIFDLAPGPDGGTVVTMRESMSGFFVKYFYSSADLAQSDQHWLADLKAAAERS